ncbi:MAG: hypothetical protein ACTSRP_17620 [Candidatus Helarchaeota archaeon]
MMDFKKWLKYISYTTIFVNIAALIVHFVSLTGVSVIKQIDSIVFLITIALNFVMIISNLKFHKMVIVDVEKWVKIITWSFLLIILLSVLLIAGSQLLYLLLDAPPYNVSLNMIIGLNISGFILVYILGIISGLYNIKVMDQIDTWIE